MRATTGFTARGGNGRQTTKAIVAKRTDAPYRAGARKAWLKLKNRAHSRRGVVERRS